MAVQLKLSRRAGGMPFPGGVKLGWEAASPPQVTGGEPVTASTVPPARRRAPYGARRAPARRGSRRALPAKLASLHRVTPLGDPHLLGTIPTAGDCLL